jgi:hypothetical protein
MGNQHELQDFGQKALRKIFYLSDIKFRTIHNKAPCDLHRIPGVVTVVNYRL